MGRSASLVLACALAFSGAARAQVGDPPPPPAPLDDVAPPPLDAPPTDPADEGTAPIEPPPVETPPPPVETAPPRVSPPLPPPDMSVPVGECPSAPAWPLAGAAAGLAGGLTFAAAAGGLLALSWWTKTNAPGNDFAPVTILVGATTLPFLAGLGAGAAILPLGRPVAPMHYVELCGVCGASWALSLCLVGAAVGGSSLGCSPGSCGSPSCGDPFDLDDADGLDEREDVYWAAIGAGLGAVAGAALTWVATFGFSDDVAGADLVTLAQVAGGAALGAGILGAIGGGMGAREYEEEIQATAPARCRERR